MSCPCASGGNAPSGGCCGGASAAKVCPPLPLSPEELKQRAAELTSHAPLMLFIKGTFDNPKCKFSRALMHLLVDHNIAKFGCFNILEDAQIREFLKETNHPTFPQVYYNGNILGGLSEMKAIVEAATSSSSSSSSSEDVFVLPKDVFGEVGGAFKATLLVNQPGVVIFTDADAPRGKEVLTFLAENDINGNVYNLSEMPQWGTSVRQAVLDRANVVLDEDVKDVEAERKLPQIYIDRQRVVMNGEEWKTILLEFKAENLAKQEREEQQKREKQTEKEAAAQQQQQQQQSN